MYDIVLQQRMSGMMCIYDRKLLPLVLILISALASPTLLFAREFVIYSVSQDLPMGTADEKIKKNYYVDIGEQQGVREGVLLDVHRMISIEDPYQGKKRYNHRVKIGTLKVLHVEEDTSIARADSFKNDENTPVMEINNFMIGDQVGPQTSR